MGVCTLWLEVAIIFQASYNKEKNESFMLEKNQLKVYKTKMDNFLKNIFWKTEMMYSISYPSTNKTSNIDIH